MTSAETGELAVGMGVRKHPLVGTMTLNSEQIPPFQPGLVDLNEFLKDVEAFNAKMQLVALYVCLLLFFCENDAWHASVRCLTWLCWLGLCLCW